MSEAHTVGLDLAKHVFQAHGAGASGRVVLRKRLRREQVLEFFASEPPCSVAVEACSSARHRGRALADLGHTVRLIPPAQVKPFAKRQRDDAADAEAICEAAQRPTMRFVALRSEAAQANAVVSRARDLPVRQRTQAISALRGPLGGYGLVAAEGPCHVSRPAARVEDPRSGVPEAARQVLRVLVEALDVLPEQVEPLGHGIARRARQREDVQRPTSMPGVGPTTAAAPAASAPPAEASRKGRGFAAWAGLTPLQRSTGGQQRPGATSKMGERTLRRLPIIGASPVVCKALREGVPAGSWPERVLARRPRVPVTVALADKMARTAWAPMAKGEAYRAPAVAA